MGRIKKDIITSPFVFKKWCSKLKGIYSLDVETTSLNYLDLEIIGFSICDGKQACYVDLLGKVSDFGKVCTRVDKEKMLRILDFYIGEAEMIIMHNANFDMLVLKKYGIEI